QRQCQSRFQVGLLAVNCPARRRAEVVSFRLQPVEPGSTIASKQLRPSSLRQRQVVVRVQLTDGGLFAGGLELLAGQQPPGFEHAKARGAAALDGAVDQVLIEERGYDLQVRRATADRFGSFEGPATSEH